MTVVRHRHIVVFVCVLACCAMLAQTASPPGPSQNFPSRRTSDRLANSAWWPTKGDAGGGEYVGAAQCGACHEAQFKTAQNSAMAHAATRASESQSVHQNPALEFKLGSYSYRIHNAPGKSTLIVSHANASHSAELLWAFGMGRIAQTYVYQEKGAFYESHVSFYTALQDLDVTPGHPRGVPPNLEEAAGREMPDAETRRCFGCHTTASCTKDGFNPRTPIPGVSCEACHGPGARHVAAAKSGDLELAAQSIVNPAQLAAADSVDFCGACHRTWQDVVADSPVRTAALNVRFAPYRLENSRCWKEGKGDARITCLTCHDPHQPLVTDPASYDAACLKCHDAARPAASAATKGAGARTTDDPTGGHPTKSVETGNHRTACTIGVKLCVTCHMPKFTNTGFHFTFTDHWIRPAEAGGTLPD